MSRISKAVKKLLKSGKQSPFPDDENLLMMNPTSNRVWSGCDLATHDDITSVTVTGLNPPMVVISYHDMLGNNITNSVETNSTSVTITTPKFPGSQVPEYSFYVDESAVVDEVFEDETNNLKARNAILKASSSEEKKSKVDDSFTKSEREIEFGDDE